MGKLISHYLKLVVLFSVGFVCLTGTVRGACYGVPHTGGTRCRCWGYTDFDRDGRARTSVSVAGEFTVTTTCDAATCDLAYSTCPDWYPASGGDCDDNNDKAYPGASEICGNGIDENCNGIPDDGCNEDPVITQGASVSASMEEDGAWTPPTISATDADGDTLTWSNNGGPSDGTASVSGSGPSPSSPSTLTYTPTANYYGTDSFVVGVSDGNGGTATTTVNVTITSVNDEAPVITEGASKAVTMDEDGAPTAFSLTLNATDIDNDTLTWSISSQGANGTAGASGTGNSKVITYTPDADYNNDGVTTDTFRVKVSDGGDPCPCDDEITVNVTVNPRNDSPVNTVAPTFSGNMVVGETLSKSSDGTWNDDADGGTSGITYAYQWQRADDDSGTNLADISVGSTYILTSGDAGKYIRVRVTATDDGVGLPAR